MLDILSIAYEGQTFSNSNRIQSLEIDILTIHGIVKKDFAKNEPFIGSNLDCDSKLYGMFMKDIYYLFGLVMMMFT